MPNTFTVTQGATLLNAIVNQMTGNATLANINNLGDFISAATTTLENGFDPVINAISQIWSRTVFASRPYEAKLASLAMPADKFGNAVRKLSPEAKEMTDDAAFLYPSAYDSDQTLPLGDGQSVDMYKINKQKVLQTNFYGSVAYNQSYTVLERQLQVAFQSPEELTRFFSMMTQERRNDRESYEEGKARALQLNYIAAILAENDSNRVIHLLSEYNALTGLSLTATTVYQPENFKGFTTWLYSRIETLINLMGERSNKFQTVITGHNILRHSKPENIRVAFYAPIMAQIKAMVVSGIYNPEVLKLPTYESIGFWQSIDTPQAINITPVYTNNAGAVITGEAVTNNTVVGVIHDRDAIGYSICDTKAGVTPYNIAGDYYNDYYKFRFRMLSDMTEKGIVLCMD